MMKELAFTVYAKAEPQGSMKAFVRPGSKHASVTSDNRKLKPFRSEVTAMAIATLRCEAPMFEKGVAVHIELTFTFLPPKSVKKRIWPVVKPDIDKLQRAMLDALTGVAWHDDAQVVQVYAKKRYGQIQGVAVVVREV